MAKIIHGMKLVIGLALMIWKIPIGLGWFLGTLFMFLLNRYRDKILTAIIGDFTNFSTFKYITYLIGVIVWIVLPLLAAIIWPNLFNPFAIFASYLMDRWARFLTLSQAKEVDHV